MGTILAALAAGVAPEGVGPSVWRVGVAVPVAVRDGTARWTMPAGSGPVLVVASSLAREAGPFPLRISTHVGGEAEPMALADDGPSRPPEGHRLPTVPVPPPVATRPPLGRTFHVLAHDGDPASAANYATVSARLRAVGERVQVYVDERDLDRVGADVLRDVVATFDRQVFPLAEREIGLARDVDGDGRFTVLFTGQLGRLGGGRNAVDGFVRAADFDPALAAPFSNRGDLMYLNAALTSGPHLRTVLAHEYTHAISFSRPGVAGRVGPEEEGWLDEGLAHLAEDRHGFSRTNLDYRVRAFLDDPSRYQLAVADYYAANLFRSHGNRGSTYLFLRSCADDHGPDLLPRLLGSAHRGRANLEHATGEPFARLFRRWSVSLYRGAFDPPVAEAVPLPRTTELPPGGSESWAAAGTSPHYVILSPPPQAVLSIEVSGPAAAELQVTAVPLPPDRPRLALSVRPVEGSTSHFCATLRESGGQPVRLERLEWEPLTPPADPKVLARLTGTLRGGALATLFESAEIAAMSERESGPLALPVEAGRGPLVVRVTGRDRPGRAVVAWAVVGASGGPGQVATGESSPALTPR